MAQALLLARLEANANDDTQLTQALIIPKDLEDEAIRYSLLSPVAEGTACLATAMPHAPVSPCNPCNTLRVHHTKGILWMTHYECNAL